jgi:hypothetical protein
MIQIKMPEMLLIAGTGRNSGKTTLACHIIKKTSTSFPVIAIKITPHFHRDIHSGKTIIERSDLVIKEETDPKTGKDSSLMLKAGALRSYFVMAKDEQLKEALQLIIKQIPDKTPIVCESGGLRHWIEPGAFLMMNRSDNSAFKPGAEALNKIADSCITFDGNKIDFDYHTINFSENKWSIIKE